MVALAAILVLAAYVWVAKGPSSSTPPPTPLGPPAQASLNLSKSPVATLGPDFWGVNVRADEPVPSSPLPEGTEVVRWPGGELGDRLNVSADGGEGIEYNDSGATEPPTETIAEFASWCETEDCAAIVTLPGEIDEPSAAAYEVWYVEQVVRFHPLYWEIGNEPGLWEHFGIPWTQWTATQQVGVAPTTFAEVVHAYIAAIRGVDPAAQFVGLGGVGSENEANESTWIEDTVDVNGPNLSAVAIHAYPAGAGTPGESAASIYASLWGADGLEVRVPRDRAAISAACPSCHIQVIVDEYNAASGATLDDFLEGAEVVPYDATLVEQAMTLNVTSLDFFDLQGGYGGAWISSDGSVRPVSELYSELLPRLGDEVFSGTLNRTLPTLYVEATENGSGPKGSELLLVNTNTTNPVRLSLVGSRFPYGGAVLGWNWSTDDLSPTEISWPSGAPPIVTLPPESVTIWVAQGVGLGPVTSGHPVSWGSARPSVGLIAPCAGQGGAARPHGLPPGARPPRG